MYDALNVLMAMNIISKEKKDIRWIGLPTNSVQECQHIEVLKIIKNEANKAWDHARLDIIDSLTGF